MSGVYKGIYKGTDRIVKIYYQDRLLWGKAELTQQGLEYQDLGNGFYKIQTIPGKRYMVTLTDEDAFDIGTKQFGMDIRNSYTRNKIIKFTARTNETHFRIYRQDVSIVSVDQL